jgi:hypothetical protein
MGFNCGIVGLPNVGKSTIFNAMTSAGAAASNYPFCTIEPNVGMVPLRDKRMDELAAIVSPERILPTTVEFVDIAGIVKGASKGEGLGNQFLGHIRSVDMIAHVVRCFEDPDVVHVDGKVDPVSDIDTISTELMLADLEAVEKRLVKLPKLVKSGDKDSIKAMDSCTKVKDHLEAGNPVRTLAEDVKEGVADLFLLTAKPMIYIANMSEDDIGGLCPEAVLVKAIAEKEGAGFVALAGKIEAELAELSGAERAEFLEDLGIEESGIDLLATQAHDTLGLITFFTAGEKEVRAWTVAKGAKAPAAAGVIHSDFEKGFIRAEVMACVDFVAQKGEVGCKEKGLLKVEGKDYLVKDGDVMHFRFNV